MPSFHRVLDDVDHLLSDAGRTIGCARRAELQGQMCSAHNHVAIAAQYIDRAIETLKTANGKPQGRSNATLEAKE